MPSASALPEAAAVAGNFTAQRFALPGPIRLVARRFADPRGVFAETWSARDFAALGIDCGFVQDNQSRSVHAGTVRGLHFQLPPVAQAKLVRVLRGSVLDVAVDIRRGSPGFGDHVAVTLTAEGGEMLFVPAGFAHGFCTLEPDTEVAYKVSAAYDPGRDRGIAWNDPALGIAWPVPTGSAVLSDKDRAAPLLADASELFA